MSWTSPASRPRAATRSASSPIRPPAARPPTGNSPARPFAQIGRRALSHAPRAASKRHSRRSLRVWREVLRLEPDVVHGHGSKGGLYARAMGFLPCRKRIACASIRRMAAASTSSPAMRSTWRSNGWSKARPTCCCSKATTSPAICRRRRRDPTPCRRVAKNGLRPEEFTAVPACPDAAEFLYIGELSTYKGVDTLIQALATIHAETELKPRLVIVGSGCRVRQTRQAWSNITT